MNTDLIELAKKRLPNVYDVNLPFYRIVIDTPLSIERDICDISETVTITPVIIEFEKLRMSNGKLQWQFVKIVE